VATASGIHGVEEIFIKEKVRMKNTVENLEVGGFIILKWIIGK
jgi:hypothetical protein